jgi:aminoglycoside phosphotransferase (APT) family kinase protein
MAFVLDTRTVGAWATARGLVPADVAVEAEELAGGVSAVVIAVRVPATGRSFVVKQALPRLRVVDEWLATQDRTETEAAAMELAAGLSPGAVPRVLAVDPDAHVMAMELVEGCANWQAEVAEGRAHAGVGEWAGRTLGAWHAGTVGRADVAERFGSIEAFEQLRLNPFHETVMERVPELADLIAPRVGALRHDRRCLVHGDYSMKNMLVGPSGPWVLDFEVAHVGNPLFDLGFFLSFVVLSAIHWEPLAPELNELGDGFLGGYAASAGKGFAGSDADVVAHTACLVLARTDGKSPAQFLDPHSRVRAREIGTALLRSPDRGLWSWR